MKKQGCLYIGVAFAIISGCGTMMQMNNAVKNSSPKVLTVTAIPTATFTSTATLIPTTSPATCTDEWKSMVADVMYQWPKAQQIDVLDAIITKYDHIKLPYGCGNDDLLDKIDTEIRIGMGETRTAMMTTGSTARKHVDASIFHFSQAEGLLAEYNN